METWKLFDRFRARENRTVCRPRGIALLILLLGFSEFMAPVARANVWGRLANRGFEGQRIKATFFFAGPARDGSKHYSCTTDSGEPSFPLDSNLDKYTLNPEPTPTHLNWSPEDRATVMTMMADAGINVITMSYWGEAFLRCSDGWVSGAAPMQDSAEAQDNLFDAAAQKSLLIAPLIESRALWTMRDEFPVWIDGTVSPGLVSQIVFLINRYLHDPKRAGTWARVYDRFGVPRYAVGLIHAASAHLEDDEDEAFAQGFDRVAAAVAAATGGVQVGFFIDAIPRDGHLEHASFKPSSRWTGPSLLKTKSLLGIQCFIPEIFVDESDDDDILAWKRDFLRGWISAGIPTLVDVSPGYDGHLVNKAKTWGLSAEWFDGMTSIVNDFARAGIIYNSWNGYTEAMVGTPTRERGTMLYDWLKSLNAHRQLFVDRTASGPQSGTASEPFRAITDANNVSSNGDFIYIRTGSYPEAITFSNQLTLVARDGPATIGSP
jgi:hypothetical protein